VELKRLAAIILLILLMLVPTYANSWQSVESDMTTPVALPSKQTLKLIGSCALTVDGQVVGGMAVYDDVATRILTDYAEIYNPTGDLLAIVWLDRLGILRSAVDRGIVQNKHALEGVFVLVLAGELV
jgi:hypothetical protein